MRAAIVMLVLGACGLPDHHYEAVDATTSPPIEVWPFPFTVQVTEGAHAILEVTLASQPAGDVVLELTPGLGKVDVNPATLTLTPENYQLGVQATVDALSDADARDSEDAITITGAGVQSRSVPVQITDDDVLTISASALALTIPEDESRSVAVKLTAQPVEPVLVHLETMDGPRLGASPENLLFTPDSWSVAQPVVLNASHDADLVDNTVAIDLVLSPETMHVPTVRLAVTIPDTGP